MGGHTVAHHVQVSWSFGFRIPCTNSSRYAYSIPTGAKFDFRRTYGNVNFRMRRGVSVYVARTHSINSKVFGEGFYVRLGLWLFRAFFSRFLPQFLNVKRWAVSQLVHAMFFLTLFNSSFINHATTETTQSAIQTPSSQPI
jgi:hypothetical protein